MISEPMAEKHQHTVQHLRVKIDAGSNDFRDYRKLGSLLFRLGQYQECPTLFETAKNLSRKNLDKAKTCVDLGWTAFWSEKYEQSRQLGEEALAFLATEKETPEVLPGVVQPKTLRSIVSGLRTEMRENGFWSPTKRSRQPI